MNVRPVFLLSCLALPVALSGCHGHSLPTPASEQVLAQQRAMIDSEREQLTMIPPPSKSRFMAVHGFDGWENPFITVQPDMLTLHILLADANTSPVGAGGMFRPSRARRQEMNISTAKLAEAITSVPQASWPYGRVVAIEEAHKTPSAAQPAVRRTLESAVNTLSELGVVVYDLNEGSVR